MKSLEYAKQKLDEYVDKKTVVSVIAAGTILASTIYGLKKIGFKKAAEVVKKAT